MVPSVFTGASGNDGNADCEMDIDTTENQASNAERFRAYAAECRRLARRASEQDRRVLNEIADAWISAGAEAERKDAAAKKNG